MPVDDHLHVGGGHTHVFGPVHDEELHASDRGRSPKGGVDAPVIVVAHHADDRGNRLQLPQKWCAFHVACADDAVDPLQGLDRGPGELAVQVGHNPDFHVIPLFACDVRFSAS